MDALETIIDTTEQHLDRCFLNGQRKACQSYVLHRFTEFTRRDLAALNYLSDELQIFAYLARFHPVINPHGRAVLLKTKDDLELLKQRSNDKTLWYDPALFSLFKLTKKRTDLPDYQQTITNAGKSALIVDIWGKPITYDDVIRTPQEFDYKTPGILRGKDLNTASSRRKKALSD